jgi:hypothetical protein
MVNVATQEAMSSDGISISTCSESLCSFGPDASLSKGSDALEVD